MKSRFSISHAWDQSKARMTADGKLLTAVALALVLLPQALVGTIAPPPEIGGQEQPGWAILLVIVAGLLGLVGQIAIIRLALGSAVSVGEAIGHGARRMPILLAAIILLGLVLVLAMIPLALLLPLLGIAPAATSPQTPAVAGVLAVILVIVFLAISPKFQLIVPTASMEPVGPIALLKRSWNLSKGHYWALLGFVLLMLVAGMVLIMPAQLIAGVVVKLLFGTASPLSVGALVFSLIAALAQTVFVLIFSLMIAYIYAQLAGEDLLEPSVPTTGS